MAYAHSYADIGQELPHIDPTPRALWDGLLPNAAAGMGLEAGIFAPSVVAATRWRAAQNQSGAVEWDAYNGRPMAAGLQNMYLVVARNAIQPATLDPQYGIQNDTYANVYRNIASVGSLFQN